ncbi:MAG TPA: BamA/TamA family outer membrane protein, partial [Rhodothermales bacterium]|nr:BamA/TamA family outer membrane protein [Rhodothermales bacterium]
MKPLAFAVVVLVLGSPPRPSNAQDRGSHAAEQARDPDSTSLAGRVLRLAEKVESATEPDRLDGPETLAFAPVLGGLRRGASLTAGVRFIPYRDRAVMTALEASASIRAYWGVAGLVGYRRGRWLTRAFARYRYMPQEDFYGIGPDVTRDDRSDYLNRDVLAGGLVGIRPFRRALVGVHASYLANNPGRGRDHDVPDLGDAFSPESVPGFGTDTRYGVLGLWLEWDGRNVPYEGAFGSRFTPARERPMNMSFTASRGLYFSVDLRRYQQLQGGAYDFYEAELEAQQYIPFHFGDHVLAFRENLAMTSPDGGDRVPFYLFPTLGGSRTLRAYHAFLFRDRGALVGNAEYRWNGLPFIQPALFLDAG